MRHVAEGQDAVQELQLFAALHAKKDSKETKYTIAENGGKGIVQIADDVVTSIVGLAVTEVDGVARLTGDITRDLVAKLGKKNLAKGIRVAFDDNEDGTKKVKVAVSIEIKFGYNILAVSESVQEKVKSTLLTMTGLECSVVNVKVSGIDFEDQN